MATNQIGKPQNRVDGRDKVTGQARYAAEFNVKDLAYGVVVSSAIAKGRIKEMDTSEALRVEGVLEVFTSENRPKLASYDTSFQDEDAPPGSPFRPLFNRDVLFNMQPIALVVAETYELARYAASLVKVEYETEEYATDFEKERPNAYVPEEYKSTTPPDPWGKPETALKEAEHKVAEEYSHPSQHHNPMEMHATTAVWEGDGRITVYDKIQGVLNSQEYIMGVFGLAKEDVRVLSPFVGGAFGSGLRPQYQLFMAVMATLELKRSVRVALTRPQMFSFGHRPKTVQQLSLGAAADGTLEAVVHHVFAETSRFEDYSEDVIIWPGVLYKCDNVKVSHKLVGLDVYTPLDMRAPGGTTGIYALECAIDELSYKVGMDPVEFRLKNYSVRDQNEDKPFSSKELRECYRQGAELFGWKDRKPQPRSMREGHNLIGWGVANGAWEATQKPSGAKAVLTKEGKLTVSSATADIGTGTYTIMSQIAAECMGLPIEAVEFKLGDSSLPQSPLEGGSWTASTVGSAVKLVCEKLGEKLLELAQESDDSPFKEAGIEEVEFTDGQMRLKENSSVAIPLTQLLRDNKKDNIQVEAESKPSDEQENYSPYSHSAVFVEVKVDEDLGTIKVTRVVTAVAGGRILNPKTARSQILGGVVWGIGMALEEESVMDHQYGRFINHDLAEYHVPVNADVHDVEVIFVDEEDSIVNPLGVKGLGEIGIVSVAPAIANAVYHATGKRVRDLPITLDKVM
ncbi:xanthine dehydrogenase family protein molybdopterin-binding subunit [Telluribacter sp. SYSU D00476]|uniref:xanthine dehydrogenase family protein molybdopterin-binding subunit n=1 Tax=Telluribacter sp. SYSU D00476 TaxID=2811430 RepID=UPI001FF17CE3|nr:xanthine dehydrogenase family protein molybdopterin-binding subunit [Telluribacter sp. SYSU D00476]